MIASISDWATVSESENATIEKWQNKVRVAHLNFSAQQHQQQQQYRKVYIGSRITGKPQLPYAQTYTESQKYL